MKWWVNLLVATYFEALKYDTEIPRLYSLRHYLGLGSSSASIQCFLNIWRKSNPPEIILSLIWSRFFILQPPFFQACLACIVLQLARLVPRTPNLFATWEACLKILLFPTNSPLPSLLMYLAHGRSISCKQEGEEEQNLSGCIGDLKCANADAKSYHVSPNNYLVDLV